MKQNILARKNLEKRFKPLRKLDFTPPTHGWLRAIRQALGITTKQLGHMIGVVSSRITALEQAEVTGATTLKSLRQAAEAMDCTLVYALVPTRSLDDLLREHAVIQADKILARSHHSMGLENQSMNIVDIEDERKRLIKSLLEKNSRHLWDQT
jgi:predicted DNA-binding mobile mystery protein A